MINRPHTTLYWQWLCQIIGLDSLETHSYLLGFLYSKLFCAFCEDDHCRIQDGLDLRRDFCENHQLKFDLFSANLGPVNVLEVLVAFCLRIEIDITCDPRNEPDPGKWFWIMMQNLNLYEMDDSHYDEEKAEEILDQFLERHFMPDGRGGIFIFKNPAVNARELSLWEQLCTFLNENPHLIS